MKLAAISVMLGSGLLCACAAQSFQPRFKPPVAPQPSVVVSELTRQRLRQERPVAVGLSSDPMRLFAYDLKTGLLLWEKAAIAKSAPLVAADSVVLQEAQGVVVRDLASGEVRAVIDEHAALIGADGQGDQVVVSMAQDLPNHPGEVALLQAGKVRWRQALALPVGVPAIFGEYVLVPWATQRLSALSTSDGRELGRFHYTNTVMGRAVVENGRLYVGQLGLLPVDAELLDNPRNKRAPYTPQKRSLPGQPALLADGYVPVADPDNASQRLQVTWSMGDQAQPSSAQDLLLLRFYRLLFALEASSDAIRWVRTFDHDLVGAEVESAGTWLADSAGQLSFLDAAGGTRFTATLGRGVRVVTLRAGGYAPPLAATTDAPRGLLRDQVYSAASLDDDRLSAGRAYAASYLSRFAEPEATSNLVGLCAEAKFPEPVRAAACAELVGRKNGEGAVLQALRVRASFLEGTEAPPVGPLAQAAAKMQIKQAGPLLVSHIEDPNTAARDLAAAFQALETLGERSSAASVERFVRLHHAEPEGSELAPALAAALHALGALRGAHERATLQDVASDALTPKSTRDQAQAALNALDAPSPKPEVDKPAEVVEPQPQDEVQTDPRSYALTPDVVRKALWPLREKLSHCLALDASHPRSGRTSLVIDGSGRVEGAFVLPVTLQACVEPLLRETHFPSTRLGRQRITHVFYGPNAKPAAPSRTKAASAKRAVR